MPGARLNAVPLGDKEGQMMPTSGQEIEKRSDFGPISVSFSVRGPTPPLNDRGAFERISRAVHFGLLWSTLVYFGLLWCIPV
jgi:hypothetical protein